MVMRSIRLKISDLAAVAGYTRFQMDGLIKQVFGRSLGKIAGTQRSYSPQDLLVVSVITKMEQRFAVDRKSLARISDSLRAVLSGPRSANRHARLLATFDPPVVRYLESSDSVDEGIVVALGEVFSRVDEYLGVSSAGLEARQAPLPMPPISVPGRPSRSG